MMSSIAQCLKSWTMELDLLGSNSDCTSQWLYDFGEIMYTLCVSVSSFIKGRSYYYGPLRVVKV